ncbi:hypothetical protein [Streptomyces sp. NPDC001761]
MSQIQSGGLPGPIDHTPTLRVHAHLTPFSQERKRKAGDRVFLPVPPGTREE